MIWRSEDVGHAIGLNDLARIHHRDTLSDFRHDGQIVRNQYKRHAPLLLQTDEQCIACKR